MNYLVVSEQGIGDTIHFARYGYLLKQLLPNSLIGLYTYRDDLSDLLGLWPGWDDIFSPRDCEIPAHYDIQIAMMSIPRLLSMHKRDFVIPPVRPKFPPPAISDGTMNIGFCWRGNPSHPNDQFRSIAYPELLPIIGTVDVNHHSYSFQWGDIESGLKQADMSTWIATAHSLLAMDLIITVDTGIAHLAATLGVPTWMMVASHVDWRWGVHGKTTPWYPTMSLFRQTTLGDWRPIIQTIQDVFK